MIVWEESIAEDCDIERWFQQLEVRSCYTLVIVKDCNLDWAGNRRHDADVELRRVVIQLISVWFGKYNREMITLVVFRQLLIAMSLAVSK